MELLAGTADGLYHLGGEGGAPPRRLVDGDVAAVAVDTGGGTDDGAIGGPTVWAVVDDTTLVRRGADGVIAPVATHERALRCLLASPHGLFVGTAGAGLLRLHGERLHAVEGFADVAGRDRWSTPWGAPPDTRSLAVDEHGTLYANVHVGGIARSTDAGATWQPTIDPDADVHQVAVAGDRVVAATAYGLAVSDDGGASWRWRTDGLHARYARAVTVLADQVFVSVSRGPGGARAAVYHGELDGCGPLTRCRDGLPEWFRANVDTGCLAAFADSVALADAGIVYHSADAGRSWDRLVDALPVVRWLASVP